MKKTLKVSFVLFLILVLGAGTFLGMHTTITFKRYNQMPLNQTVWSTSSNFKLEDIPTVQSNSDGSFKIMLINNAGFETGIYPNEVPTLNNLRKVIEFENPNFVIAMGDLVSGVFNVYALRAFASLMEEMQIKWAYTFGDNDGAKGLSNAGIANVLKEYPHSMLQVGPSNIAGFSNYFIHITHNSKIVFQLNFLDSNGVNSNTFIKQNQIDWFQWTKQKISQKLNRSVPSMLFTHVPLKEFAYLYESGNYEGSVNDVSVVEKRENSNLFEALKQVGDVKAVFAGQFRLNTMNGMYDNIHLSNTLWSGYHAYQWNFHNDYPRGTTMIELDTQTGLFETTNVYFNNI